MSLDHIKSLVQSDLAAIDTFITNELSSSVPLINEMVHYIISCGGKRIRPLLVLLSAKACNHQQGQHIKLAAAIELIHTATLLHDDVVDHSNLRRGNETANSKWGNQASILVGDFLYSRAFQIIVAQQNFTVMDIFASATNLIAEGEMLQLLNCFNPETTEQAYFDVIERKTGKLFEVSTQLGPAITNASTEHLKAMESFGMNFGIAYQLIDDALDFTSEAEIGKSVGNDLAEGKPTLPLIYAMQKATRAESKLIHNAISKGKKNNLEKIIAIIQSTHALEYTANVAKQFAEKALASLLIIPESPYKKALNDLTHYVVERHS